MHNIITIWLDFMSKRFKEIRTDNKLTQEEFANKLNLKQAKVREIEGGRQKILIEIAIELEDKFNINLRWLLSGRGNKYLNEDLNQVNVNNHNGNVAVNGTITIKTKDYADNDEIKEIVDLLKYAGKPLLDKFVEKLQKVKQDTEEF